MSKAKVVFTDSGGIQEESTVLGIPCITLRENTERPVTMTEGTNILAGTEPYRIKEAFEQATRSKHIRSRILELWDGKTGERIVRILLETL